MAAILLSALGVPWETIRADYLLSNRYRELEVEKRLAQIRQMAAERQGVAAEDVDMTNMNAFLIQDGSYIDASRDGMIASAGSVDAYINQDLGFTHGDIRQLRESLLEA